MFLSCKRRGRYPAYLKGFQKREQILRIIRYLKTLKSL